MCIEEKDSGHRNWHSNRWQWISRKKWIGGDEMFSDLVWFSNKKNQTWTLRRERRPWFGFSYWNALKKGDCVILNKQTYSDPRTRIKMEEGLEVRIRLHRTAKRRKHAEQSERGELIKLPLRRPRNSKRTLQLRRPFAIKQMHCYQRRLSRKGVLSRYRICQPPILDSPTSRTVRNTFLFIRPPILQYLVIATQTDEDDVLWAPQFELLLKQIKLSPSQTKREAESVSCSYHYLSVTRFFLPSLRIENLEDTPHPTISLVLFHTYPHLSSTTPTNSLTVLTMLAPPGHHTTPRIIWKSTGVNMSLLSLKTF